MKLRVTFQWIDPCPNERLRAAQKKLLESIEALGLEAAIFPAGPEMVKFGDILRHARRESAGTSFAWCNSDVLLTKDPFIFDNRGKVHGFHRRELPSGEMCAGVDMYLIPNLIWDNYLSRDIPDLWCGASHIDWWLTRASSLIGAYEAHSGFIDHYSHPQSDASKRLTDPHLRHNVREYNAWAARNGAGGLELPARLPLIG
ncbi:MAG TPA: hypothetical protein VIS99_14090, partial [Terrimicrobiaceae bacterium]